MQPVVKMPLLFLSNELSNSLTLLQYHCPNRPIRTLPRRFGIKDIDGSTIKLGRALLALANTHDAEFAKLR